MKICNESTQSDSLERAAKVFGEFSTLCLLYNPKIRHEALDKIAQVDLDFLLGDNRDVSKIGAKRLTLETVFREQ